MCWLEEEVLAAREVKARMRDGNDGACGTSKTSAVEIEVKCVGDCQNSVHNYVSQRATLQSGKVTILIVLKACIQGEDCIVAKRSRLRVFGRNGIEDVNGTFNDVASIACDN